MSVKLRYAKALMRGIAALAISIVSALLIPTTPLLLSGSDACASPKVVGDHDDIRFTERQAKDLVTLLYQAILFREPDIGGLEYHIHFLVNAGYPALIERARHFAMSNEYNDVVKAQHSPAEIANNWYTVFLRRPLDQDSPLPAMIANQHSADAVQMVVDSDEFFAKNIQAQP